MENPGKSRFEVSLAVLVPLILAGVAVLVLFAAYGATSRIESETTRLWWLALPTGLAVFVAGVGLIRWLLGPFKRFMRETRDLPVLAGPKARKTPATSHADLDRLDQVFHQVTEVLSRLDAKSLFPEVVGVSRAMRGVLSQVAKVAPSRATVLIIGESGTGKELIARAIHERSDRARGPLIAVNCAAVPEGLLESELFGHEKGAFTGAVSLKKGRFETANGGTLLLDEIGDMPLATQAKILRAIETGESERVGGTAPVPYDVRVVAATNKDLAAMVAEGTFREDLYHRLNVFPIDLPPLRARREDIPLLADHFLAGFGATDTLSQEGLQSLMAHDWPGNVRELQNVLQRAVVLTAGGEIRQEHLKTPAASLPGENIHDSEEPENLDDRLARLEKGMILAALSKTGGVQVRAAELLGIKERSLWHRIKKYGIDVTAIKGE